MFHVMMYALSALCVCFILSRAQWLLEACLILSTFCCVSLHCFVILLAVSKTLPLKLLYVIFKFKFCSVLCVHYNLELNSQEQELATVCCFISLVFNIFFLFCLII